MLVVCLAATEREWGFNILPTPYTEIGPVGTKCGNAPTRRRRLTRGCSPGTCCGYGYGPATKNYTIALGFSGPTEAHRTPARDAVFYENTSLSPYEPDSRDTNSYKEKITLPRVLRRRLRVSVALPHFGHEGPISVPGWGILTPFPFGRQRDKHSMWFAFRQTSSLSERHFSDPFGPTDPCSTAVHMETFSSFSPQGSHLSICYYHQICTGGGSRRAHARQPSTHPPRPSYSLRVNLHEGSSAVAPGIGPTLERHPFSG
ncbi:hypothetical protein JTE90_014220 [Oedothorax gibbosus]|uniref:Uncharacterized protein n=1 Tax=Oedothorax gibbosus TaxID=931172 RepID=A0AAV6TDK6_9ARAC|nr:hypothetical protein JTE90_014220 [Oedothorax gibbosus]